MFALGVDGVKGDRADETDFTESTFAAGPGTEFHNLVPVLYQQVVRDALGDAKRIRGEDPADVTMMFRAGFAGSQVATNGMWGGDQEMTFQGLQMAVRQAQSAGSSGFPIWGSDVGGYSGPVTDLVLGQTPFPAGEDLLPSEALFLRWAQFGAITPVFEIGGRGRQQEFWNEYSPATAGRFRRSVVLHYELYPYHHALATRAATDGTAVLRPLGYDHPDDPLAWANDQELMLGPDLLMAPVTAATAESTDPAGSSVVPVYLPAGAWVDAFTGATINGGQVVARPTSLDESALYLRAGAAIPFNGRDPDAWGVSWRTDDLDRGRRAGWLWAPGAGAVDGARTRSSAPIPGTLTAGIEGRTWRFTLEDARPETQIVGLGDVPLGVVVNGRTLERFDSVEALRGAVEWVGSDPCWPGHHRVGDRQGRRRCGGGGEPRCRPRGARAGPVARNDARHRWGRTAAVVVDGARWSDRTHLDAPSGACPERARLMGVGLLFVYGTLQHPPLLARLLGRVPTMTPARLPGHRAAPLTGRVYPGLVVDRAGEAGGRIFDATEAEVTILDAFEGSEYRRTDVVASTDAGAVPCQAWLLEGPGRGRAVVVRTVRPVRRRGVPRRVDGRRPPSRRRFLTGATHAGP